MKIDFITRHFIPNYGSFLQSYALQETIKKLGYESEIINYIPYEEKYYNVTKTLLKGKKWERNVFYRFLYRLIQNPNYYFQYKKFNEYRKKYLVETEKEYGNIEELKENIPIADVYCSGSDQIWGRIGTVEYDSAYFLEFIESKKCISYASSFGKDKLNESLNNDLSRLLKKYSKILVRENTAKNIILNKGFNNVSQVLDPAFLLSKEDWIKMANYSKKSFKNRYVLVYQLHNNKKFDCFAKEIARRKKMKLIRISPSLFHIFRSGKLLYLPNPCDFLKTFCNAEYVLTDSFHATVFSIIFNKKFVDIMPNNKTGTRIESVLSLFDIDNRLLNSFDDFDSIDKKIDWNNVNRKLENERKKSIDMLRNAINSI